MMMMSEGQKGNGRYDTSSHVTHRDITVDLPLVPHSLPSISTVDLMSYLSLYMYVHVNIFRVIFGSGVLGRFYPWLTGRYAHLQLF